MTSKENVMADETMRSEDRQATGVGAGSLHIGIDVGSTTVKLAILDEDRDVKFSVYRRHHADVRATIVEVLAEAAKAQDAAGGAFGSQTMTIAITGSGGLLLAQWLGVEFVQEVIASKTAVETFIPATDVAIELGGEDAKIIYFDLGIEQRMNGTCAGGTGAFIDQMASLLNTDAGGLNELAQGATTIYPIASRCGVFAKTDVQPLLNEGARKEDIAASIFQSVVTQTISGLACGRPIRGNVAFLGGPLQYLPQLRKRFYETLELDEAHRIVPENAHLFVACGCAMAGAASETVRAERLDDVLERLKGLGDIQGSEVVRLTPCSQPGKRTTTSSAAMTRSACAKATSWPTRARRIWASTPAPPRSRPRSSATTVRFCGRTTPTTRATCSVARRRRCPTCTTTCRWTRRPARPACASAMPR